MHECSVCQQVSALLIISTFKIRFELVDVLLCFDSLKMYPIQEIIQDANTTRFNVLMYLKGRRF